MKNLEKRLYYILIVITVLSACDDGSMAHEHEWGEWKITTPATCMTTGMETRICSLNASHSESRSIPINQTAHNYKAVEGQVIIAPTYTTTGTGKMVCIFNALHTKESGVIPALGHNYGNWTITTNPTCTTSGIETGICTNNAAHTITRPKDAIGHDFSDWISTATFLTAGEESRSCKHSGCSETERNTVGTLTIKTASDWSTAKAQLNGKIGSYTLTIDGNIGIAGNTANSFGDTTNDTLNVTLKGSGRLFLTGSGNIIKISKNQIFILDSQELTLQGTTSNTNYSIIEIISGGTFELKNGIISGNISNPYSGGVYVGNGTFIMSGGKISGNTARSTSGYSGGGGVFLDNNTTFIMNDGEISGNRAISTTGSTTFGGGVYVYGTNINFTMNGGKIINNSAMWGGGIYIEKNGNFTMTGGEINGNTASAVNYSSAYGGGVFLDNSSTFTMSGGVISNNTAATEGGGVNAGGLGSTFTMNGTAIISNNSAREGSGVVVAGNFIMSDNATITENIITQSYGGGGGVTVKGGTFIMDGGKITNNTGDGSGNDMCAGVDLSYGLNNTTKKIFMMNNGEISNNSGSGIIVGPNYEFIMNGGKIFDNTRNGVRVYKTMSSDPDAIFTMNGGEISGNSYGVNVTMGFFRLITGTIYGSNEQNINLKNDYALQFSNGGAGGQSSSHVQYGTYNGNIWNGTGINLPNSQGGISWTTNTIKAVNGLLQ